MVSKRKSHGGEQRLPLFEQPKVPAWKARLKRRKAARAAGRAEPAPYFTLSKNTVDDESYTVIGEKYRVHAVGCKSRFCPVCSKRLGVKLRQQLIPVLQTFQGLMMLTLTVDPKLFASPEIAYRYVRDKRAVAELVRALYKAGHVKSRRYFYVVEWQKNTQMAHFHLLVESNRVPFDDLAAFWGRNRPKSAPPRQGSEPEFGHVRFSKATFASAEHAASYATKYLTKLPEQGYPQWVLDFKGQIRMFATSRDFFPRGKRGSGIERGGPGDEGDTHKAECFCRECRGKDRRELSTPGDRLRRCGTRAVLIVRQELMNEQGEVIESPPLFIRCLDVSFSEAHELCGQQGDERSFDLEEWQLGAIGHAESPALFKGGGYENGDMD